MLEAKYNSAIERTAEACHDLCKTSISRAKSASVPSPLRRCEKIQKALYCTWEKYYL